MKRVAMGADSPTTLCDVLKDPSHGAPSAFIPADMSERIHLVQVAEHQQVLVNTLTTEIVKLAPANDWQLVYDKEDRNGMVFRAGDMDASMYLHDLFKEEVFEGSQQGEWFIKTRGGAGWKRLTAVMLERREMKVSIRLHLLAAKQLFTATVFRRKRPGGFMVYWPVPVLYHLFSMSSFSGWASKWVQHSYPRWSSSFRKAFGYDAFVGSTHGNTSKGNLEKVRYTERCLEQLSCSTPCFVWLLSRWAYASREQGGLTVTSARASADEILRALLDVLLDAGSNECEVPVRLTLKWASSWPLPETEVAMVLCVGGALGEQCAC